MEEIWKNIEGYEGLYMVSSLGRVKSLDRYNGRGHRISGRILKPRIHSNYWAVQLCKGGECREQLIHTGIDNSNISACCKGKIKSAGGYIWRYYNLETYLIGVMNNNIKRTA